MKLGVHLNKQELLVELSQGFHVASRKVSVKLEVTAASLPLAAMAKAMRAMRKGKKAAAAPAPKAMRRAMKAK